MPSEMTGTPPAPAPGGARRMPRSSTGLRTDPAYNAHLSPVTGTVRRSAGLDHAYKIREAAGEEIYYIIERRDGVPCGVVRLYDITADSFTWGSWILNADKPPGSAGKRAAVLLRRVRWLWASRGPISTCAGQR